jgi:hypothetical protein
VPQEIIKVNIESTWQMGDQIVEACGYIDKVPPTAEPKEVLADRKMMV